MNIESEKRFRDLFYNAQIALFRAKLDGKLIEINKKYAEMVGYSSVQECLKSFSPAESWADPKDRDKMFAAFAKNGVLNDYETRIIDKHGKTVWIKFSAIIYPEKGYIEGSIQNISTMKLAEIALKKLNQDLEKKVNERTAKIREEKKNLESALAEIKTLSGLFPICSHCKNIRDDSGYWNQIEEYIHDHSEAQFSHGICPECAQKHYPDLDIYDGEEA